MTVQTSLAQHSRVATICEVREKALTDIEAAIGKLDEAYTLADGAISKIVAQMPEQHIYRSDHSEVTKRPSRWDGEKLLEGHRRMIDRSIWQHIVESGGISDLMDAKASKEFRGQLSEDPAPATFDNIMATIEQLSGDAELIFQRGLANAFSALDRRFKSHDAFKVGNRIIFDRAFQADGFPNYHGQWDYISDVERVMRVLSGKGQIGELEHISRSERNGYRPQQSTHISANFEMRVFKNGNAHLWFRDRSILDRVNKVLAAYYGEVLPDAFTEPDDSDMFRRSSVPAKDLQFYPTPAPVVDDLLDGLGLNGRRVLEPSAGRGAIALAAARAGAQVDAIEINPDHIEAIRNEARGKGLSITTQIANFLKVEPRPVYDFALMNPPFYGTHYMDHIRHAFDFLAPGGILRAVVPTTAEILDSKKHIAFQKWAKPLNDWGWAGPFKDLPAESFASSGTRISTSLLLIRKPR